MASFGLNTAGDFLGKLRAERDDFVLSKCLDSRHAISAVMTGYHLCEWVYPEIASRPDCQYESMSAFREAMKALDDSPLEDAGRIANGTKHFKQGRIKTGADDGAFQRSMVQDDAFDVPNLWLERDGKKQRAEDFIDELLQFWDTFFQKHGLAQFKDGVARFGRQRCQCGKHLVDFDNHGVTITGCPHCNRWEPLGKRAIRLDAEDLREVRLKYGIDT